jgi:hypothetical protein
LLASPTLADDQPFDHLKYLKATDTAAISIVLFGDIYDKPFNLPTREKVQHNYA